jgi:zinc protease
VQKQGVSEAEVEKARMLIKREEIQSRQSSLQTAVRLGEFTVFFNDPELINTYYEKILGVTPEQIKKVAAQYLVPSERAVVITVPAPPQARQAAASGK